jgi:hypothetical protein
MSCSTSREQPHQCAPAGETCDVCRLDVTTTAVQSLVLESRTIPKHHASSTKIRGQRGLDFGGRCDIFAKSLSIQVLIYNRK